VNPAAMLRLASAITDLSTREIGVKLAGKSIDHDLHVGHNNHTRQSGST